MSLNNIQLPSSVVADLYRSSLIDTGTETTEDFQKPSTNRSSKKYKSEEVWKYLGGNQKNILIAVDYKDAVHLPDDELALLTNMLSACKLSLDDVAIINRNNHKEAGYKELSAYFKSKIVFLFDIEPSSFGLAVSFPHFQVQSVTNTTFLFSPALEEIKKDKLLKSKLWVCLQKIFGV